MVKTAGRVNKTKTRKGKKILEDRAPKIIENDKVTMYIKGGKTSETVTNVMKEFHDLNKALSVQLKRHNPYHPFEDETPFEKFSQKLDASLFCFGINSKKHPNSIVMGRMHDNHLLDMAELGVQEYVPSKEFPTVKIALAAKPCVVLEGEWDKDKTMKRVGNLMADSFRGPSPTKIRLQGLEHVISLSCVGKKIRFRVYRITLKKSDTTTPRVELEEMGPRIDFELRRHKLADDGLYKQACKQPRELTVKARKNTSENLFGTKLGRVHVGVQDTAHLPLRKVKALKPVPMVTAEAMNRIGIEDAMRVAMEE